MAEEKGVPTTRFWSRPWLDTSIATAFAPCCLNWCSRVCTRTGLGVVWVVSSSRPQKPLPTVPMMAQGVPSKSAAWASHCEIEVLPLVPVTPQQERLPEKLP